MTRYVVSTTEIARADVRNIAEYLANSNPVAAQQFAEEFILCVRQLSDFPFVGHNLRGLRADLSARAVSRRFSKYLVIYRQIGPTELEIVRVVHGSRDLPHLLRP
jgi:plasmid stabilization system protein ParE